MIECLCLKWEIILRIFCCNCCKLATFRFFESLCSFVSFDTSVKLDVYGYKKVKEAIEDTWRGCLVSPYLMVQCSDSRHYSSISDRVYRFSAMDLTSEERKTIHGNDEHIRLETIGRAVEFFYRVIKNS